jgi:hypothetical protein
MNMGSPLCTLNVWSQFQLHTNQVFFAYEIKSRGNWKVILCWKPRGRRLKFNNKSNLEIPTFDLGNNANYVGLRMKPNWTTTYPLSAKCGWHGWRNDHPNVGISRGINNDI